MLLDASSAASKVDVVIQEARTYQWEIVRERRHCWRLDLVSGLSEARDDSGRLTETELLDNYILLLIVGNERTVNLTANGR